MALFTLNTRWFVFFSILSASAVAQPSQNKTETLVHIRSGAPQLAGISGDTIIITKGSTYAFTVDTPEDSGLVRTVPLVEELLQQLEFTTNTIAIVENRTGITKSTGRINEGDQLVVKDANTRTVLKRFHLQLRPLAKNGRLSILNKAMLAGKKNDLQLAFTAGQRTPNATVRIFIPEGIDITLLNTTINVIGRGAVLLKDLSKQSIGRTGNKYSYSKVGTATIEPAAKGKWLILSGLDLRPANGHDIVLVIKDVIPKTGTGLYFQIILHCCTT